MIKFFKEAKRFITVFVKRYKQREKLELIHNERYKPNRTVIIITIIFLLLIAAAYYVLFSVSSGTYLSGWFFISAITVVILLTLSAPYSIILTNKYLTLHGYIDITQIPVDTIKSLEIVESGDYKYYFPLFASLGYLGFFGVFVNLKKMEISRVYASKYSHWIIAKTEENGTYIFNVKNPNDFIDKFNNIIIDKE